MQYQQLIITEPVSNFRALARQGLQGRWGDAFAKGLLYTLVLSLPLMLILALTGGLPMPGDALAGDEMSGGLYGSYYNLLKGDISQAEYMRQTTGPVGLAYFYEFLVLGALTLGITRIFLRYRRRQEAPGELLFSGFSNYGRAFAAFLLMTLFTILWTLLFVIPGIIAVYRYKLVFYILAENPDVGPFEAIRISKEIMRGNKWKLFCLDLSFIGWMLLAMLASSIISFPLTLPFASSTSHDVVATALYAIISSLISGVTVGLLQMYQGTSEAAFYERATGLLKYVDEMQPGDTGGGI
ncbi:MAG: DUF975 family protein [Clostridiales Family XIII bacterium]|jgi:uncharacterized membrane protein|nr:DUF975 family protein [Clostridiales Family XIII bacterium]